MYKILVMNLYQKIIVVLCVIFISFRVYNVPKYYMGKDRYYEEETKHYVSSYSENKEKEIKTEWGAIIPSVIVCILVSGTLIFILNKIPSFKLNLKKRKEKYLNKFNSNKKVHGETMYYFYQVFMILTVLYILLLFNNIDKSEYFKLFNTDTYIYTNVVEYTFLYLFLSVFLYGVIYFFIDEKKGSK